MTSDDRRLVAIVVADVVGYSAMMELDEADTLSSVFALQSQLLEPAVSAGGGRIVKTMGDGFLIEFPSVVNAVESAIAVQEGLAGWLDVGMPLRLRIGVHLGDVAVHDGDIFGDGVNIAARLEQAAEPGGILISAAAHDQTAGHFGGIFTDVGVLDLKNISRAVHAWRWGDPVSSDRVAIQASTDKPTVAVLPFDNLSSDSEQDYFAEGMVEDLITMLSRFHWFRVTARNSSFALYRATESAGEVARQLGARYVLEGSIRRSGTRIRVSARLIDSESDTHIWADRFDAEVGDIFDLQDEIVRSIVGAVVPGFVSSFQPAQRAESATSISSWELAMRGWNLMQQLDLSVNSMLRSRDLFERALADDDANSLAYCGLSFSYSNPYYLVEMDRDVPKAVDAAQRALEINDRDAFAWCLSGVAQMYGNNLADAERRLKRAIAINPSLALAHAYMALASAFHPDSATADQWARRLKEVSPADPMLPLVIVSRSMARFGEGDYFGALALADEALESTQENQSVWRLRAASLEMLGDHASAMIAVENLLTLAPVTMNRIREIATPFADPEPWTIYLTALKNAGIPE